MTHRRLIRDDLPVDTATLARSLIGKIVVRKTDTGLSSRQASHRVLRFYLKGNRFVSGSAALNA